MVSLSPPTGVSAAILPGSRSRGGTIQLWPNPVPFECGIIHMLEKQVSRAPAKNGCQRFPVTQLKKLLLYTKGKGKVAYPNIRFSAWLHIAMNKLYMTEELAWLYFETFDVVCDVSAKDRLDLLQVTSQCSSIEKLGELRKKMSLNTLQFILFLYMQNIPRLSLKTPMVTGDEWPSPESELRQKSSEYYHLMFLKTNLQDILELLQEPEQVLTEEAVNALGFILCACKNSVECALLELAISAASQSGYSQISKTFALNQFEFWIRSLLNIHPFGPYNLMSYHRELKHAACFRSDGNGRILINTETHSRLGSALLYRTNKQTIAMNDTGLHHSNIIYIRNCQRSNIYLLAPLRSVHIEKCSRCVLVLGTVSSAVVVNNSDSLTVITACRRIHMSSSSMCVLHLLTMTRPLLLPGCLHITLAPYNTHYPSLQHHIKLSGLSTNTNCWNSPVDLTGSSGTNDPSVWEVMPPEVFRPMEVPFDIPGDTKEIPCVLPTPYLNILTTKRDKISQWYDLVGRAQLSKEQSKQLWTSVKDHFEEWLGNEGHKKELLDLTTKSSPLPPVNVESVSKASLSKPK